MIQKLRVKFISASMLSLALVRGGKPGPIPVLGHGISPETPFESRFFSVLLNEKGQVLQSDTGQIAAVDDQSAGEMAQAVWSSGSASGFQGDYRYIRAAEAEGPRFILVDCGRSLSNFRTTLIASVLVALAGLLAVFLLLLILSKRIVRPVAESYEKQRRFITDAGHELKTPLTIIGADLDLVEPELEGNEWLQDIRCQVRRLTGLTQDLIFLSRMEEETPPIQPIEFPLSDLTEEMAQSFQGLAKAQGKRLTLSIPPMLSYTGDEKAIRQLLSILLDNALKYTPEEGEVEIALKKEGRMIRLSVSNTIAHPMERETLGRLFDRFYRPGSVHCQGHRAGPQGKNPGREQRSVPVGDRFSAGIKLHPPSAYLENRKRLRYIANFVKSPFS